MNKTITIIIVLVIIILGSYFILSSPEVKAPSEVVNTTNEEEVESSPVVSTEMPVPGEEVDEMVVSHFITYTNTGYSPNTINVKVGDTVTFKNESTQNMWTASAVHPSHVVYSGTSLSAHCPDTVNTAFDACKGTPPGESWSFTFDKVGSWKYHNHLHASNWGEIVVE